MQIEKFCEFHPEHVFLYDRILHLIRPVQESYPQLEKWYKSVFLPGLFQGERGYVVAHDQGQLVGCALIKKTPIEKKLCTLFVRPDFRRKGVGVALLEGVIEELGPKPFVSVSEESFKEVMPLFKQFGFQLSGQKRGPYRTGKKEFYFNGMPVCSRPKKIRSRLIAQAKQKTI